MVFVLYGLVTGLFAGVPLAFDRPNWRRSALLGGGFALIGAWFAWLVQPQLIGPFWGSPLWCTLVIALFVNMVVHALKDEIYPSRALAIGVTALLVPFIGFMRGCGAFRHADYYVFVGDSIEKRDWQADMKPVDPAHIRMVSKAQAGWMAKKALGQGEGALGSSFFIHDLTIQKVGDEQVWVAPLEFVGFWKWMRQETSPGYVIVSAEDPHRPPDLVSGHAFSYMPSAYFGHNLQRHLYTSGYVFRGTMDYSFELDDERNPWWVVTVFEPTIGYFGEAIQGVVLVNPTSGEIQEYALDAVPAWVDRVIPLEVAFGRLIDYGKYANGWLNSWLYEENVVRPTDPRTEKVDPNPLWLVWGDDGKSYWFTGMSSINRDDSLVSFVLMDSRTGAVREYKLDGTDESGVMLAVNKAVSNYTGFYATQPVLYNIYGELTWVVPVISEEGIFQRLALVRASNTSVVLGEFKNEALVEYKRLLAASPNSDKPSATSEMKKSEGVIDRYGCAVLKCETQCSFTLAGDRRVFVASPSVSPSLILARAGDRVQVGFIDTFETIVPVNEFDVFSIGAHRAEPPASSEGAGMEK